MRFGEMSFLKKWPFSTCGTIEKVHFSASDISQHRKMTLSEKWHFPRLTVDGEGRDPIGNQSTIVDCMTFTFRSYVNYNIFCPDCCEHCCGNHSFLLAQSGKALPAFAGSVLTCFCDFVYVPRQSDCVHNEHNPHQIHLRLHDSIPFCNS